MRELCIELYLVRVVYRVVSCERVVYRVVSCERVVYRVVSCESCVSSCIL